MRPQEGRSPPEQHIGSLLSALPLGEGECRDFRHLIEQALAQDPDGRFQSARQFADALRAILAPDKVYQPSTDELAATVVATRQQVIQRQQDVQAKGDSGVHHASAPLSSFSLTGEETSLLSQALSSYLGPVSGYVVKEVSAHCQSFEQLIARLADKIPDQREREQFRRSVYRQGAGTLASAVSATQRPHAQPADPDSSGGAAVNTAVFSPQQLEHVTRRLAIYLGPMASRLVKQMAQRASSLEQLQHLLAERIPNADERHRFLNK
jgi:hypothetical protein